MNKVKDFVKNYLFVTFLSLIVIVGFIILVTLNFSSRFNFKIGECIKSKEKESWEKTAIFRVDEVGKNKYKLIWLYPYSLLGNEYINAINFINKRYTKVNCDTFEEIK